MSKKDRIFLIQNPFSLLEIEPLDTAVYYTLGE